MMTTTKLYKWQESCLQRWKENEYRGIVNVITGAGKTMVALAAMDHLLQQHPDLRVKIVVPTIPLANQWNQALLKHIDSASDMPGFVGGGRHDNQDRRIMIYIINSARSALSRHIQRDFSLNHPVFLVCDECHHYQSKENRKIFDFLKSDFAHSSHLASASHLTSSSHGASSSHEVSSSPGTSSSRGVSFSHGIYRKLYHCMGLSATPFGTQDDLFLTSVLGNEIFSYGFQQAADDHIISSFYICQISVSFLPAELKKYRYMTEQVQAALRNLLIVYPHLKVLGKEDFMKAVTSISRKANMDPEDPATQFLLMTYQRKSISVLSRARLLCCINLIRQLPEHSRIILFCEQKEQAEEIYRMIERSLGPIAGLYHSSIHANTRVRILSQFRDRSIRVLCSCRCLDEGIDVPDADIGIVISSSSVSRQRVQRLGRIIRQFPGKHAACLYYLYVRESTDETVYLKSLESENIFNLRYYTQENLFSNELYEYAARMILERQKELSDPGKKNVPDLQQKKMSESRQKELPESRQKVLTELRACLIEGLTRPDYLLPVTTQTRLMQTADSTHQKNYWHVMKLIGSFFRNDTCR